MVRIQTPRDPDEPSFLSVSFAKLLREVSLLQTERLGELLRITIQRLRVETIGIEKQRDCLHAARKLAALSIEKLTALRARLDCGLLLLAGAVGEIFVLRELEVDQPGTNYKHPEANKSRDEKRAAWRDIRSGL